jgi:hypothetical protein
MFMYTKIALSRRQRKVRNSAASGRSAGVSKVFPRRDTDVDLVVAAFAAVLYKVVTSAAILSLLSGIVTRALNVPF